MGIVYYGLNLKSMCVEQSSVGFALRYDYPLYLCERPRVELNDFVCEINHQGYDRIFYTLGYHDKFVDIIVKVDEVSLSASPVVEWMLSGEIVLKFDDASQKQNLYFDFQSSFVRKSALCQ